MSPGFWLLPAAAALAAGLVLGPKFPRVWLGLTLLGAAAALAAALQVLLGPGDWDWRGAWAPGGERLHFRLDGVSALFLALVAVIGGAGAVYSLGYWTDRTRPRSAPRGRAWWCGLLLSMGLVLVAANGLHFLVAWELFTLCAYFLITLDRRRAEVRAAGWLYLAASHAGTACLLAFFAGLAARTGSWELGDLRGHPELAPLFWLALAGFGVKAGMAPLHFWLPSAHANAPSHVSALMSGAAIKLGVYGLVRFGGWLPLPAAAGWTVLGLGAAGALFGIIAAVAQNDLKRMLASCSVENIGIILVGLGMALLAVPSQAGWGRLALAGALLHVWNHGLFKSLLFLASGSVLHATGTREMSRLGGLWRAMPWTASLFTLGALAIASLPPLNGFVSEWLLYLGLFDAADAHHVPVALAAALLLAVTGALALACFLKAAGVVFLGSPRSPQAGAAHECGPLMRLPMIVLAFPCVLIGLAPVLFWPAVIRAVGAWNPAWADPKIPDGLAALGSGQILLVLLVTLAAFLLSRRIRPSLVRAPTWTCGYAFPSPRMQSSAGSFSGIISDSLAPLLQAERRGEPPRGLWPTRAARSERLPELLLERVLAPAARGLTRASGIVRRLQNGRLQSYILYLIAGLALLAAIVLLEGRP